MNCVCFTLWDLTVISECYTRLRCLGYCSGGQWKPQTLNNHYPSHTKSEFLKRSLISGLWTDWSFIDILRGAESSQYFSFSTSDKSLSSLLVIEGNGGRTSSAGVSLIDSFEGSDWTGLPIPWSVSCVEVSLIGSFEGSSRTELLFLWPVSSKKRRYIM